MSWRDFILNEITPGVTPLTLVADSDGLLLDEVVLQTIQEDGFDLMMFEDPIEFRYEYETKYREHRDHGELSELVVVTRGGIDALDRLPYDLLHASRRFVFSLVDVFPYLSYPVVCDLDISYLDALYDSYRKYVHDPLGEQKTKDFVLRHVFGVTVETIKKPVDLLKVLIERHRNNREVPESLDDYILITLETEPAFEGWPLSAILSDRDEFFVFLQERWPIFIDGVVGISTGDFQYELKYPVPEDLPFSELRSEIDTLFLEGLLRPIETSKLSDSMNEWYAIGLLLEPDVQDALRLERLAQALKESLPDTESVFQEWLDYALRYAELNYLFCMLGAPANMREEIEELQERADSIFIEWAQKRYSGLHDQPPPVMLHHVPRALLRRLEDGSGKVALVLVDGLALNQWIILREALLPQQPGIDFHESALFAWLPTLTSVSRQAALSGLKPLFYAKSINRTDKDESHWRRFWTGEGGLPESAVGFEGNVGDGLEAVVDALPSKRAVALIMTKVDKITHGMVLGALGMHQQVRLWAQGGLLGRLLATLHEKGFETFITSDHGNVEAIGAGSPKEGQLAETRGERVRVYNSELLRGQTKALFPEALEWPALGLPDDYLPLFAPQGFAFTTKGERVISHGGLSIEEVVVPWIEVEWRKD
jgi:hypothetical protein